MCCDLSCFHRRRSWKQWKRRYNSASQLFSMINLLPLWISSSRVQLGYQFHPCQMTLRLQMQGQEARYTLFVLRKVKSSKVLTLLHSVLSSKWIQVRYQIHWKIRKWMGDSNPVCKVFIVTWRMLENNFSLVESQLFLRQDYYYFYHYFTIVKRKYLVLHSSIHQRSNMENTFS